MKAELDAAKNKLEQLKRIQKIELKHAKLFAQKQAEDLLKSKLHKMKAAYEFEFGKLARQFAEMQDEVREKREEKKHHLEYIRKLEGVIAQQRNYLGLEERFVTELAIGDCPPDDKYDQ